MNEQVETAFSHEGKIYGVTSSGHLAEWNAKELKWVVRGTNEVFDHATAKAMKAKHMFAPGELKLVPNPKNIWQETIIASVFLVGLFICLGIWLF